MLLDVFQEHTERYPDGREVAPARYDVYLHPSHARRLLGASPEILQHLQSVLRDAASTRGVSFLGGLEILLVEDASIREGSVRIETRGVAESKDSTQEMVSEEKAPSAQPPKGAFIIVDGRQHVSLDQAVVHVGRRQGNDLVIDDPQASRNHAQLRVREKCFVLFDLGSTHGTWVNNRKVHQHILQTGDVIRIGRTRLVYGEDTVEPGDVTPTYIPSEAERSDVTGSSGPTEPPVVEQWT